MPRVVILFFSYWVIYSNGKNIYTNAFILGILLDIIEGGTLGQNAVALVLSSAFILNVKKSFFVSNLTTQQVYIFLGSIIYLIIFLLVHQLTQGLNFEWLMFFSPFISAIVWPLIRYLLAKLKQ